MCKFSDFVLFSVIVLELLLLCNVNFTALGNYEPLPVLCLSVLLLIMMWGDHDLRICMGLPALLAVILQAAWMGIDASFSANCEAPEYQCRHRMEYYSAQAVILASYVLGATQLLATRNSARGSTCASAGGSAGGSAGDSAGDSGRTRGSAGDSAFITWDVLPLDHTKAFQPH